MIIGMCGAAGAGKDTAALYLTEQCGYERIAFADAMRGGLYALDPIVDVNDNYTRLSVVVDDVGWDRAKQHPDVRGLLQRFGTEVGRDQWGEDVWVDRATSGLCPGDRVVFTDVRFANEALRVRQLGGVIVLVERPDSGLTGTTGAHPSENRVFQPDVVITNDGTIDDLHDKVHELLAERTRID